MQRPDGKTGASQWCEYIRSQCTAGMQCDPANGDSVFARSVWFRFEDGGEQPGHWRNNIVGRGYYHQSGTIQAVMLTRS